MARLLALEWDKHEARAVIASVKPGEVSVEHAFAVPLVSDSATAEEIGRAVAGALAERGLSKLETLIALGRNSAELRVLTLPPAPPEDLPDVVRFQAQREFSSLSADSPLDFVELSHEEEHVAVLAAAAANSVIQEAKKVCEAWDGELSHLLLRPFATASLWSRSHPSSSAKTVMLVDVLETDADLTVLVEGQVTFLRTVRLPQQGDESAKARALLGEVRRTMVAARSQTGGRRVDEVVWIGATTEGAETLRVFSESLEQEVTAFEPFTAVSLSKKVRKSLPSSPGHFAPLLGALLDEAHDQSHAIDFLHPRRRPEPPNPRNKRIAYGALAATVMLMVAGMIYGRLWMLDAEIQRLQSQLAELKPAVEKATQAQRELAKLDEFAAADVTWIDEIASVSEKIPSADDMIVSSFSTSLYDGPGGRMFMKGYVRTAELIRILEDALRYGQNHVDGKRGVRDPSRKDYSWMFDVAVTVPPDKLDRGRSLGRPWIKREPPPAPPQEERPSETTVNDDQTPTTPPPSDTVPVSTDAESDANSVPDRAVGGAAADRPSPSAERGDNSGNSEAEDNE